MTPPIDTLQLQRLHTLAVVRSYAHLNANASTFRAKPLTLSVLEPDPERTIPSGPRHLGAYSMLRDALGALREATLPRDLASAIRAATRSQRAVALGFVALVATSALSSILISR